MNKLPPGIRDKIRRSGPWLRVAATLDIVELTAAAIDLECVGGLWGSLSTPTLFSALLLRMLQISPPLEIVEELATQPAHKYLRVLALVYARLVLPPVDVHRLLRIAFYDYRRVRQRTAEGNFEVVHVDEIADVLVSSPTICGIPLPALLSRANTAALHPRMVDAL